MTLTADLINIDDFIARWSKSAGAERANFQGFAYELCDILGVFRPTPSVSEHDLNPYAFERGVMFKGNDGATAPGRIDLYKKSCFVLEAKQSRQKGGKKELKLKDQTEKKAPESDLKATLAELDANKKAMHAQKESSQDQRKAILTPEQQERYSKAG